MAIRCFKYFTIVAGGTPQPLVGTTLTAALSPPSQGSSVVAAVADSSMFMNGDYVMLDVGASRERASVYNVVDSTHITLANFNLAHANSTYVQLSGATFSVYIQTTTTNAGAIYLGNASTMVKATGVNCLAQLLNVGAGIQPIDFSDNRSFGGSAIQIGDYWVDGTTGDKYLPSCGLI